MNEVELLTAENSTEAAFIVGVLKNFGIPARVGKITSGLGGLASGVHRGVFVFEPDLNKAKEVLEKVKNDRSKTNSRKP